MAWYVCLLCCSWVIYIVKLYFRVLASCGIFCASVSLCVMHNEPFMVLHKEICIFRHGNTYPGNAIACVLDVQYKLVRNTINALYVYLTIVTFFVVATYVKATHLPIKYTVDKTNARNFIILSCAYNKYCLQPNNH